MQTFWTGLNGIGLVALITIAYGIIQSLSWPRWVRHSVLGVAFGAGAWVCMMNPIEIAPGVIADSRNLFVSFAGAFLGPMGAGIAFVMAGAVRLIIGGNGMLIGLSSMILALIIGVFWGFWREKKKGLNIKQLALMGLSLSLTLLFNLIFLQGDAQTDFLRVVPFFAGFNLFGAVFFGALFERERSKARYFRSLLNQSFHDPLTNALNRRGLEDLYDQTMVTRTPGGRGVLLLDLDHFKIINDTHGHAAGDETLKVATQAIKDMIRSTDILARVGGEEFVVLFPQISERDFLRISERIRTSVKQTHDVNYLNVTVSIGGTFWNTGERKLAEAIRMADKLMYAAKNQGRDRFVSDLTLA